MPYACSAYGGRVDALALARRGLPHLRPARGAAVHGVLADQPQRLPHLAAAPLRARLRRHARRLAVGGRSGVRADHGPRLGRGRPPAHAHEPVLGPRRRRPTMTRVRAGAGMAPTATTAPTAGVAASRRVVEMPPGFAPAFGLPIRFVPRRPAADARPTRAPARRRRRKGGPARSARSRAAARCRRDCPAKDLPPREPFAKRADRQRSSGQDSAGRGRDDHGARHTDVGTPKPAVRPATPTESSADVSTGKPEQAKPKPPEPRARWQPPTRPHRPERRYRQHRAEDHQPPGWPSRPHPATACSPSRPRRTWRRRRSRYLSGLPRPSPRSSRPRRRNRASRPAPSPRPCPKPRRATRRSPR